jgi:hypothetical protein
MTTAKALEVRVQRLAIQHARPRRIQRALARLRARDPAAADRLRGYHLYERPVIERTSKSLAELEPARRRRVLQVVVAACGGTIEWR